MENDDADLSQIGPLEELLSIWPEQYDVSQRHVILKPFLAFSNRSGMVPCELMVIEIFYDKHGPFCEENRGEEGFAFEVYGGFQSSDIALAPPSDITYLHQGLEKKLPVIANFFQKANVLCMRASKHYTLEHEDGDVDEGKIIPIKYLAEFKQILQTLKDEISCLKSD